MTDPENKLITARPLDRPATPCRVAKFRFTFRHLNINKPTLLLKTTIEIYTFPKNNLLIVYNFIHMLLSTISLHA